MNVIARGGDLSKAFDDTSGKGFHIHESNGLTPIQQDGLQFGSHTHVIVNVAIRSNAFSDVSTNPHLFFDQSCNMARPQNKETAIKHITNHRSCRGSGRTSKSSKCGQINFDNAVGEGFHVHEGTHRKDDQLEFHDTTIGSIYPRALRATPPPCLTKSKTEDPETHPLEGNKDVPGALTTIYLKAYETATRKLTSYKATRLVLYRDYKATRLQACRDYRLLVAKIRSTAWWP